MKKVIKKIVEIACLHLYWGVSECGKWYVCTGCGKKKERDIEKEIQEMYR